MTAVQAQSVQTQSVQAQSLRPAWRSVRWWLVLGGLIVIAGLGLAFAQPAPGRPLDPASASKNGTRALSVLLANRGTSSRTVTRLDDAIDAPASATIVLTSPDDYSSAQLEQLLTAGHRLVAVDPDVEALRTLAPGRDGRSSDVDSADPDCAWAGAQAAGLVEFPNGSTVYTGTAGCYGGRVVVTSSLVLLGTSDLLDNAHLGDGHRAAVAVNALSDNGAVDSVLWLLPGEDAAGPGTPTIWSIFPPWVGRAAWWLALVGILIAIWQGRRLGPVVHEPLPVVVRAAEVVEGHGRLYRRARDRGRVAAALRAGTTSRLSARRHLPSSSSAVTVAASIGADGAVLLDHPAPADDEALVRLGQALSHLETDPNGART